MIKLDTIRPTVSIVCITYNQEKYIQKALDGFLMQKTTFPVEIIIHDDASTDKTKQILKKYKEENGSSIKLELEKNNKFSKGDFSFLDGMFRKAKGKYIALCEGDDYWTDPTKLQQQVDFLDNNKEYSICFHPVKVLFEDNKNLSHIFPDPKVKYKYNLKELLATNFIQTNSVMYRKQKYVDFTPDTLPIDYYLHLYHAQFGKIGYLDKVMSTYRVHKNGVWWESHNNKDRFWKKNWETNLIFYNKILEMYGSNKEYKRIISISIANIFYNLITVDSGSQLPIALKKYPNEAKIAITTLNTQLLELIKTNQLNVNDIDKLSKLINEKNREIAEIKSSRVWKLRNKYAKYFRKKVI